MVWPDRAIYWLLVVSLAVLTGYTVKAICLSVVGTERLLLLDAAVIIITTVVFTPLVWGITFLFRPVSGMAPAFAGYVFLCAAIIVMGRRVVPGFDARRYGFLSGAGPALRPPLKSVLPPRLLRRLPEEIRGDVLRLSANDHVVEVVTVNGTDTLRMRLVDAIAEMEPVHGYCVHRSHWVAHGSIERVEREHSYKLFVVLQNEDRIPVSRKYRVNVEKAGWI